MRQNLDYGYEIQKLYLEIMLADAETFARCQCIFDHTLFDKRLQLPAEFINEYVKNYSILPTLDIVNTETSSQFKPVDDSIKEGHFDWLLNEFETFIRHKSLERAILASADLLEQGEYGSVEELIKQAVQIGLTRDIGTNYFADPQERLLKIKDRNGQISTGWTALDYPLFGGFNRGELSIFSGCSGAGKSLFLANLGVNWALAGFNVIYITLELSEALVSMRIDSMITGIPSREIFKNIDDVEMKVKMIGKKAGSIQVKYLPSGKNVNDIRSYLKEYEIRTGKKADILLVDYLDLLYPINKKISVENLFIKDKYVSEELRNLSMEKNCILVSASQLGRGAVEEVEYDHSHIAGGISKIQTADNVFGIFSSRNLRENGKYQLQLMKTRSSSGVGQKIELAFDVDTLRITDLEENQQPAKPSLLESIKQRSTISNNPNEAAPVHRVKADIQSAKLRELINNISGQDT